MNLLKRKSKERPTADLTENPLYKIIGGATINRATLGIFDVGQAKQELEEHILKTVLEVDPQPCLFVPSPFMPNLYAMSRAQSGEKDRVQQELDRNMSELLANLKEEAIQELK